MAASMREWGWTIPVLADEAETIIAGHARVSAAKLNGYEQAR
jgi:ParB-like chromosome segregation protein Spo0J